MQPRSGVFAAVFMLTFSVHVYKFMRFLWVGENTLKSGKLHTCWFVRHQQGDFSLWFHLKNWRYGDTPVSVTAVTSRCTTVRPGCFHSFLGQVASDDDPHLNIIKFKPWVGNKDLLSLEFAHRNETMNTCTTCISYTRLWWVILGHWVILSYWSQKLATDTKEL